MRRDIHLSLSPAYLLVECNHYPHHTQQHIVDTTKRGSTYIGVRKNQRNFSDYTNRLKVIQLT